VVVAAISQEVGAAWLWALLALLGVALLSLAGVRVGHVDCLSPVVVAVAGWLILGQHLAVTGYVAIVVVTVASIGAVRSARERLAEGDTRLITA
jgi:inner membrane transporter RhtA